MKTLAQLIYAKRLLRNARDKLDHGASRRIRE